MGKRKLIIIKNATKDGEDILIKKGSWGSIEIFDTLLSLMVTVLEQLEKCGTSAGFFVDCIIGTLEMKFKNKNEENNEIQD